MKRVESIEPRRIDVTGPDVLGTSCTVCITTNGWVTNRGLGVMGRGIAKTMSDLIPDLKALLGKAITDNGNVVQPLCAYGKTSLMSFPVKPKRRYVRNTLELHAFVVRHMRSRIDVPT